jgi:hypothetical protein
MNMPSSRSCQAACSGVGFARRTVLSFSIEERRKTLQKMLKERRAALGGKIHFLRIDFIRLF